MNSAWRLWIMLLFSLRVIPPPPAETGWIVTDLRNQEKWVQMVRFLGVLWALVIGFFLVSLGMWVT